MKTQLSQANDVKKFALSWMGNKMEKEDKTDLNREALNSFETASALAEGEDEPPQDPILTCRDKLKKHLGKLSKKEAKQIKAELRFHLKQLDTIARSGMSVSTQKTFWIPQQQQQQADRPWRLQHAGQKVEKQPP